MLNEMRLWIAEVLFDGYVSAEAVNELTDDQVLEIFNQSFKGRE